MGCCGQRRLARRTSTPRPAAEPGEPAPTLAGTVWLRYEERTPVVVRGAVSGREYAFSRGRSTQPVDVRDAPALLRLPGFRQRFAHA